MHKDPMKRKKEVMLALELLLIVGSMFFVGWVANKQGVHNGRVLMCNEVGGQYVIESESKNKYCHFNNTEVEINWSVT